MVGVVIKSLFALSRLRAILLDLDVTLVNGKRVAYSSQKPKPEERTSIE